LAPRYSGTGGAGQDPLLTERRIARAGMSLWFDRHPALAFLFEHDLFGKPDSAFPDYASGDVN
jgi:hypothetical protein